ncbi:MAG: hypothetical protein HYU27_07040 [Acidobacteria bacterium]|nr:hypothetical protein [Acidobacteriota bacterium]
MFDDQQVAEAMGQLAGIERTIRRIRLSRSILQGASKTMPTIVKTLDAIHLASAVAIRERRGIELLFATHDNQQAAAARALGCIRRSNLEHGQHQARRIRFPGLRGRRARELQ